jgi:hypothetical protein
LGLAIVRKEFTSSVSHALLPVTPVNSSFVDVSTPPMVQIVFKLTFIYEVMTFSSNALQFSIAVNLSES